MRVIYSPRAERDYKKLPSEIKEKAKDAIRRFQKDPFDKVLENHKLKGRLKNLRSFSIDNNYRIIFEFDSEGDAHLHKMGDHDIYK